MSKELAGRVAFVTGVSRRGGIGFAIARRLAELGADLFVQGNPGYDATGPTSADPGGMAAVTAELGGHGGRVAWADADLADPAAPGRLMEAAVAELGRVDVLVANHAYWSGEALGELTADEIDKHLIVNVRSSLLLAKELARCHDGQPGGRIILLTSGQHRGPMGGELAYVASKGALHQLTESLSDVLVEQGITVNTVNPGATDTGWVPDAFRPELLARSPLGRIGEPDDAARLVAWLVSDAGRWVTGQVIDSEGGFRRR